MTQAELDRQVAKATGESVKTIAERGFVPLQPIPVERESERDPLTDDWDELEQIRHESFPH